MAAFHWLIAWGLTLVSHSSQAAAPEPRLAPSSLEAALTQKIASENPLYLRNLVQRNRDKARWLLANSVIAFEGKPDMREKAYSTISTVNPRFNGRRCLRVVLETYLASRLAKVRGGELTAAEAAQMLQLSQREYRYAISRSPYDWYVEFSSADPTDNALENAEFSACLAVGYNLLYDNLTPTERATAVEAIGLTLRRYAKQYDSLFGKPTSSYLRSNWNGTINSAAVYAALTLSGEAKAPASAGVPNFATVRSLAEKALPSYYALFDQGGSYPEGPTYLAYALEFVALANGALSMKGLPLLGLAAYPQVSQGAAYMRDLLSPISPVLTPGSKSDRALAFNYSDAVVGIRPSFAVQAWAAKFLAQNEASLLLRQIASPPLGADTLNNYNYGTLDAFSVLWQMPVGAGAVAPPDVTQYGNVDGDNNIAFVRTTTAAGRFIGMLKGGRPNHTPHGHLDAGSFVIDGLNRRWSADLGPDYYTVPDYFSVAPTPTKLGRWRYTRTNNFGHSTLVIGGRVQAPDAKSKIATNKTAKESWAVVDLRNAYRNNANQVLRRKLALSSDGKFNVRDAISGAAAKQKVEWRMIYCKQAQFGVPVVPVKTGCGLAANEDPIRILSSSSAVITEEQMQPECRAKYLDIKVIAAPAGTVLTSFPLDNSLGQNKAADPDKPTPAELVEIAKQAANPLCRVFAIQIPAQTVETYDLEVDLTPKQN